MKFCDPLRSFDGIFTSARIRIKVSDTNRHKSLFVENNLFLMKKEPSEII